MSDRASSGAVHPAALLYHRLRQPESMAIGGASSKHLSRQRPAYDVDLGQRGCRDAGMPANVKELGRFLGVPKSGVVLPNRWRPRCGRLLKSSSSIVFGLVARSRQHRELRVTRGEENERQIQRIPIPTFSAEKHQTRLISMLSDSRFSGPATLTNIQIRKCRTENNLMILHRQNSLAKPGQKVACEVRSLTN